MKIKTKKLSYDEVMALPRMKHKSPKLPSILFRTLVRVASQMDLWKARFRFTGKVDKAGGPYLILMNHSSFIDLEIASRILYPMRYNIVCTLDALVGKSWLMRQIGCIPTHKFVSDVTLIHDMEYSLKKGSSVLMYPEAGYSFDGKATTLPRKLGLLLKRLNVPVLFIETHGAFTRDPLYNGLQLRRVPVSAHISTLFTKEQIAEHSVEELDRMIDSAFAFDNFAWQRENNIAVDEPFRADGLERILYRCAHCHTEGTMRGEGVYLTCSHCGKRYFLNEYGQLVAEQGETEFSHIPDWYAWQRECVREELLSESYRLDVPVKIAMMIDNRALYDVGEGRLVHDLEGFHLTGCDGKLDYFQKARSSYGLNADYYWYEISDVIGIGNMHELYYCFPPVGVSVAKARLAAEELYKLHQDREYHKQHTHEHRTPIEAT